MSLKKRGDFKLDLVLRKLARVKRKMPTILGNMAKNHFLDGFRREGKQTDNSSGGWKNRAFTKGVQRNLLVNRGFLKDDIKVNNKSFSKIVIGTSSITKDYASIHNEGASIKVTDKMRSYFWAKYYETKDKSEKEYYKNLALTQKSSFEIPQREFIGRSKKLNRKVKTRIKKEINSVFPKKSLR